MIGQVEKIDPIGQRGVYNRLITLATVKGASRSSA
ncbi:hypothetical protein SAMN05216369_3153 [Marinobacter antarcticus]|uniref:Uncharacterized protein n=1 Tax=Marinobacter antarcticus TaxID=564117 RepID=A0A1M6VF48_9GAMM|nr:hypothetical protein SAMN05216369_3153 [Marinobacter antarcticus]